ncbi:MAG: hypothetical protein NT116_02565 [Candidatus Parcubacteria bacterium]|nr:hypothetical protein [Candidatus Parcubacteria bacterium]
MAKITKKILNAKTQAFETLENMEKALKLKRECPEKKKGFY